MHGASPVASALPAAKKNVLVLSGEREELPSVYAFISGLRAELAGQPGTVEFFVEYLDFGRFPALRYARELAQHLAYRYAGTQIDAVVCYTEAALEFALANRAKLFADAPVIAAGIERGWLAGRKLPAGVEAVLISYDYRRTIELVRALKPEVQEIVIVSGVSDFDLRRSGEARQAVAGFAPQLGYRMLSGIPLAQIEDEVRRLPATSAVLIVSMVRDAEGKSYVGRDVA